MEPPLPRIFFVLIGISIQIVFACFVYAILMVWSYVFDKADDDDPKEIKIKKSDVEKGQKENLSTYWNWISKTQCNIKYGKLHDKCFVCNDCTSK